jgi:hypothetical protein
MPNSLPTWAATPVARALLDAIIADQPDLGPSSYTLPSTFGGYRESCEPRYRGKLAAQLRRIHSEWFEREFAKRDEQFRVSGVWDDATLHRVEQPDRLITRVLHEAEQQRRAA